MSLVGKWGCRLLLGVAVGISLSAPAASAQGNRSAMVDSARALIDDFNERQSISLLRRALDPVLGAPDVSWARAVQLLGQTLLQTNQREEALSWFRWALRQSPSLQVDSVNFTPALVSAFYEARAFVAASRPESRASVRFQWATSTTSGGFGDLVVARSEAGAAAPVQLSVNGEFLAERQARRLSPGSYRVAARAAGQADAEFTTEVLPGVTTLVTLNFVSTESVLSKATEGMVLARLARIKLANSPANECRVGFFAGRPGLLVARSTTSGGPGPLVVKLPNSRVSEETIRGLAASDTIAELMVLPTSVTGVDSLSVAADARPDAPLWAAHFPGCGDALVLSRVSVASVTADVIELTADVRGAEQLGVVVNADGVVAGLLTGPRSARRIRSLAVLVASARANVASGAVLAQGEGARPVAPSPAVPVSRPASKRRSRLLPIMGGVVVAGLAAVLAMPKSDPPSPPTATTGGIVIVLP